jgi:hypothetical protein
MRPALPRSTGTGRLRHQRPRPGIGLIMAIAIGIVAGVFGYYGILAWRFFFD